MRIWCRAKLSFQISLRFSRLFCMSLKYKTRRREHIVYLFCLCFSTWKNQTFIFFYCDIREAWSLRLWGETLSSLVDKSLYVQKSCEVLNAQKRFVFAYFLLYLKEILSSTRKTCLLLEDKGPQARKVFEESYCVKQWKKSVEKCTVKRKK